LVEAVGAESVNVGAGVMLSVKGTEVARPPPLTLMETLAAPSVAVLLALNLIATVPAPGAAMEAGVSVAVTPLGSPVTAMAAAALNPPALLVVTVSDALAPCKTERLVTFVDAVNEGTLRVHCTLLLRVPAVAVTVKA
jgi:hypothetical protein